MDRRHQLLSPEARAKIEALLALYVDEHWHEAVVAAVLQQMSRELARTIDVLVPKVTVAVFSYFVEQREKLMRFSDN